MIDYIATPTMGEILQEEFMEPMNISAYKLAQERKTPGRNIPRDLKEKNYLHLQRITEGLYPAARQSASARQQFMLTPQDTALWTLMSS